MGIMSLLWVVYHWVGYAGLWSYPPEEIAFVSVSSFAEVFVLLFAADWIIRRFSRDSAARNIQPK